MFCLNLLACEGQVLLHSSNLKKTCEGQVLLHPSNLENLVSGYLSVTSLTGLARSYLAFDCVGAEIHI